MKPRGNEGSERNMKYNVANRKSEVYYLKKRGRIKMEMEVKFEKLKKSGGDDMVNNFLAKKKKKKKKEEEKDNKKKDVKMIVLCLGACWFLHVIIVRYHQTLNTKLFFSLC